MVHIQKKNKKTSPPTKCVGLNIQIQPLKSVFIHQKTLHLYDTPVIELEYK